jgi:hypothetical protein
MYGQVIEIYGPDLSEEDGSANGWRCYCFFVFAEMTAGRKANSEKRDAMNHVGIILLSAAQDSEILLGQPSAAACNHGGDAGS